MLNRIRAAALAVACLLAPIASYTMNEAYAQATTQPAAPAAMPAPAPAEVTVTAPAPTTIAVGGLWTTTLQPLLESVLGVIATALIGFAATRFTAWTGVQVEQKYQDDLHRAAETGINLGLSRVGSLVGGLSIPAKNAAIAEAVNWMVKSVPDAIAALGVTPDKLKALAESKLNALLGATAAANVAVAAKVRLMLTAIFGSSGILGTVLGFLASFLNDWITAYRRDQALKELGAAQEAAAQQVTADAAAAKARQIEQDGADVDPDVFRTDDP